MADRIAERLAKEGPKRILALDGGGTRGIISVAFLEQIEEQLRQRHGRRDFVLADYFDMIGGTSVGSIIATMLALGWEMKDVRARFTDWCPKIFKRRLASGIFRVKFSDKTLGRYLLETLGPMRLDSPDLKTGLAIISKRVDTGSAWLVSNNPNAKYWNDGAIDAATGQPQHIGNRAYLVAQLIRASTAAPTYFKPQRIAINQGQESGVFVDGGVSPYNNPALLLFMMAGIKGYNLNWELGPDKLLLISVGTGSFRVKVAPNSVMRRIPGRFAVDALQGIIADGQTQTLSMLQWLSQSRSPWTINGEIDDLREDALGGLIGAPAACLSFVRYDIKLEAKWLGEKLAHRHYTDERLKGLRELDNVSKMQTLDVMAQKAAAFQVTPDDFPWRFDRRDLGA